MNDEMFFTPDGKSLRRGRRRAPRTETCRPCTVWSKMASELTFQGVVTDITTHGMGIRMLDSLPPGTVVMVQMMMDEEYRHPLAQPLEGMVVRCSETADGFFDHGLQLHHPELPKPEEFRPVNLERKWLEPRRRGDESRMHTADRRESGGGRKGP